MEIIPVIDLKGGAVVRARMGRRDQYRPIATPLSPTSDPVDVARGLLALHPFATLYIADLDAIAGAGDNRAALTRLKAEFPRLTLWVDNGIADRGRAEDWLARGWGQLVLGSETQADAALVRHFAGDARVTLSLDFRGDVVSRSAGAVGRYRLLAAKGDRHDAGAGRQRRRTGPRPALQHPRCRRGKGRLRRRGRARCRRPRGLAARRNCRRAGGVMPARRATERRGHRRALIAPHASGGLGRERMLDLVALGDHLGDLRLALDGARDRFLGGPVVVVLDLLVVGGFPVDEHADADEQIVGLVLPG